MDGWLQSAGEYKGGGGGGRESLRGQGTVRPEWKIIQFASKFVSFFSILTNLNRKTSVCSN